MTASTTPQRYSRLSIALHWAMLVLIVSAYAMILLRGNFPRGSDLREGMKMWHFMLGISVLALVVIRIVAALLTSRPPIIPPPPRWQLLMAKLMHFALYAFMLAMPIAGWTILSAEGEKIPFFGLALFPLVSPNDALAGQVQAFHETVGTVGYFLIGLHALVALYHHYWVKDDTLRRMLPGWR